MFLRLEDNVYRKYNDLDVCIQFIAFAIQLDESDRESADSSNCSKVSSPEVGLLLSLPYKGCIAQFFFLKAKSSRDCA